VDIFATSNMLISYSLKSTLLKLKSIACGQEMNVLQKIVLPFVVGWCFSYLNKVVYSFCFPVMVLRCRS